MLQKDEIAIAALIYVLIFFVVGTLLGIFVVINNYVYLGPSLEIVVATAALGMLIYFLLIYIYLESKEVTKNE